jgi:hypothetical protein
VDSGEEEKKEDTGDRMVMMAAVAMTELLKSGGRSGGAGRNEGTDTIEKGLPDGPTGTNDGDVVGPNTSEAGMPETDRVATKSDPTKEGARVPEETTPGARDTIDMRKRKVADDLTAEKATYSMPLKKRKPPAAASSEDEEVRHVVSSASYMSAESRNPSPVSTYRTSYHHHCPPPSRFPWPGAAASGRPSPPPGVPPPPPPYGYHYHHPSLGMSYQPPRASPPPAYRASPPHPNYLGRGSPLPGRISMSTMCRRPSISTKASRREERTAAGLPKSLSFRKICSRCGKTRGEHGELGFGNKCVYQDCGKCGAGYHWHELAAQPMGIMCRLTVEQGAIPGAAAVYDRKIRDLAARAELQRALQLRKQQQDEQNSVTAQEHNLDTATAVGTTATMTEKAFSVAIH